MRDRLTWARFIAWLVPVGILAQAVLAGQGLFIDPSRIGLHGGVGHGVLLLAATTAVLAWIAPATRLTALLATATVVGAIGQTGIGYAGRRAGVSGASALHIPLGVALLGLSVAVAVLLTVHERRQGDACTREA